MTLKDDDGTWILDEEALASKVRDFFVLLYSPSLVGVSSYSSRDMFPPIPPSSWDLLNADVSILEVRNALFEMKSLKAPGPDGLHALFFQSQWDVVSPPLCKMIEDLFNGAPLEADPNKTLIALIPKVNHPSMVKEFRLISLCSVAYKVVTKIIANKIKHLMPHLIRPAQSSFIKGCNITDNIIVAQELIHSKKRK